MSTCVCKACCARTEQGLEPLPGVSLAASMHLGAEDLADSREPERQVERARAENRAVAAGARRAAIADARRAVAAKRAVSVHELEHALAAVIRKFRELE